MKDTSTHTPITVFTLKCYRTLIAQNRIEILCTKIKIFSRIKSSLMSEQVNKLVFWQVFLLLLFYLKSLTFQKRCFNYIKQFNLNYQKDHFAKRNFLGTGILSMFAARAGAKKVYALEMSDIAFDCLDVIRDNGLNDIIEVKKGNAEEIAKSLPKCDIIVSEWMGYCLLFEGMLDSVLKVRDLILKPGGKMIPATARIDLCLVSTEKLWKDYLGFWDDVYGFKMKSLKKRARREARVSCS